MAGEGFVKRLYFLEENWYGPTIENDVMKNNLQNELVVVELDQQFLDGLKKAFANKEIEITVSEADETDYLLRSPPNRERLLRAVADIEQNRNIVVPEQQAFQ